MSEAKKKQKKSSENWDFKVDEEHLRQVSLKKEPKKASASDSGDLLKKKGTGAPKKKRSLQVEQGRKKKMTRGAIARRDAALEQYAEIMPPSFMPRLMATLVDATFLGGIYFMGTFLTPTLNYHYVRLLRENGVSQTLDPVLLNNILLGTFVFIVSLFLFYLPVMMFYKTPGKAMMKMRIGHPVIGERPSKFLVLLREAIVKPLSVASVIGVLIGIKNDGNRCLHDFICKTALYIDD